MNGNMIYSLIDFEIIKAFNDEISWLTAKDDERGWQMICYVVTVLVMAAIELSDGTITYEEVPVEKEVCELEWVEDEDDVEMPYPNLPGGPANPLPPHDLPGTDSVY